MSARSDERRCADVTGGGQARDRTLSEIRPPERAAYHLTPQETELLKLMVEGHHYKTAAREMDISTNTVSFHLKNIYEKLQVHSKTEAVAKALREHLV